MFFAIASFVAFGFFGGLAAVENNAAQQYEQELLLEQPPKRVIDPYVFEEE